MYCRNCGREIEKECPVCGPQKEEGDGIPLRYEGEMPRNTSGQDGNDLIVLMLKIIIVFLIVTIPILGPISGVIGGCALVKKEQPENRRFGKQMLTLSIVLLLLGFICYGSVLGLAFFQSFSGYY